MLDARFIVQVSDYLQVLFRDYHSHRGEPMTKTQQYFEQVREKLGGATDYKVAQALDISKQNVSEYVRGIREADTYACTRIAMVLEVDPLEVIAQVEAEAARTAKKREFWKSFRSSGSRVILGLLLCATMAFSALGPLVGGNARGGFFRPRGFA